jgi:hypothetical protein
MSKPAEFWYSKDGDCLLKQGDFEIEYNMVTVDKITFDRLQELCNYASDTERDERGRFHCVYQPA